MFNDYKFNEKYLNLKRKKKLIKPFYFLDLFKQILIMNEYY
jgi:hypothetical protein